MQCQKEQSSGILHGSGDNVENRLFLETLRRALPEKEYAAAAACISCLFGFQQNWVLDSNRFSALVKCRQIGGSHSYGLAAVLWGQLGEHTSIVSRGDREAKDVLKFALKHAIALSRLGSEWARPVSISTERIELASGATITALPATSGGRGKSGNMLLDEAAYHTHPEDVWDGAAATVMHGYRLRVLSTPNGVGNLFHSLVEGDDGNGYLIHRIKLSEAIADGMSIDMDACWKMAKGDPRLFDQFFNCSFLDGVMQYIPNEYIARCCFDDLATTDGEYYAGLDIGRDADLTVLIVLRRVGKVFYVASVQFMKRTDSDGLEKMVDEAFAKWKLRRLCIDSTGLGTFPAERIKKKHSERIDTQWRRPRVECVTFTPNTKEDLATGLYAAMTGGTVRLPKTDAALPGCPPKTAEDLRNDIASIKRIVTTSGNVRYDAPRTAKGHADRAWALALALHAGSSVNPMVDALAQAG